VRQLLESKVGWHECSGRFSFPSGFELIRAHRKGLRDLYVQVIRDARMVERGGWLKLKLQKF
jgi:hypothetical protein